MTKWEFQEELGNRKILRHYTEKELKEDIKFARAALVISNASPLINLAVIGQLDLLKQFFTEIHITQAVWKETVIDGKGKQAPLK